MQKWEGHVVAIDEDVFTAELVPLYDSTELAVLADFGLDVIAEADRELLQVGATFYCTVRTVTGRGGQPSRTSNVRLRRLGVWHEDELGRILARAKQEAADFEKFTD